MLESVQTTPIAPRLIADIGGTNARFALLNSDGSISDECVLQGADFADFVSAYQHYIEIVGNPKIEHAAIAIANPINGDKIRMTNHNWDFSIKAAQHALGLESLVFKNDFEALALSIPQLNPQDCQKIGGGEKQSNSTIAVLGPGTGLGVSGLVYAEHAWVPISGEGGHVSISPSNPRELAILQECWNDYTHVSAERLLSGRGLQQIYKSICALEQVQPLADITPQTISSKALQQRDAICEETLNVFCSLLGVVAGNLALTLGAKGGVYLGGGIIPKLGGYFEHSPFRERFEAKGRFKEYLAEIPVFVIKAKNPALIGIRQAFCLNAIGTPPPF